MVLIIFLQAEMSSEKVKQNKKFKFVKVTFIKIKILMNILLMLKVYFI